MPNSSASGGFLTPGAAPVTLDDDALDDLLQSVIVGVTGLAPDLVRPRWQVKPPKQPAVDIDWCAIGVTTTDLEPGGGPMIVHEPTAAAGLGQDRVRQHELIAVLASFYGPNAGKYAALARDGMTIAQNSELLQLNLMTYINSDTIRQVPELVNDQWIKRRDLPLHFRRQVIRTYAVENLVSADSALTFN